MYYIKKDKENFDALKLINDVLKGHQDLKRAKQAEFAECWSSKHPNTDELLLLEKDLERVDIQIDAILYTLDYVKLMLKFGDKMK